MEGRSLSLPEMGPGPSPLSPGCEGSALDFTELIESAMYLYRATGDPTLLELGRDAVESIEKISKVECGFATVSVSTGPRVEKCLPLLLKSLWNVSTEGTFEMYTCLYFTRVHFVKSSVERPVSWIPEGK